jgi:hypothetical protein
MAELPSVFDTDDVQDDLIPEAWYTAQIVKTEIKDTKAKDGKYISLHFKILEGEYAKRMVFTNLNIINKNSTAESIAKRSLKNICDALDIKSIVDTNELHGQPLEIKVVHSEATAAYPAKEEVKGFRALGGDDSDDSDDGTPF